MWQSAFKLRTIRTTNVCVMIPNGCQKLLLQMQDPYANIESNQAICGVLGACRHVYDRQNSARKTRTRLKRRHCVIPVSIFVVRRTRVAVSLYAGLSRETKVQVVELACHATSKVDAPYERKLSVLQTCPFPYSLLRDVVIRFYRTDFTICLSSRILVMGEH